MLGHNRRLDLALVAATVAFALSQAVLAQGTVVTKSPLRGTASAPHANGHARLVLRGATKGRFTVTGHGLAAHRSFDVIVGGIKVGAFVTNANGVGKAKFRTSSGSTAAAHGPKLLLGFDPRGDKVVVRDGTTSDDDLVGEMPGGGDSTSGAFACCHSDADGEGELECTMKTPSDCAAAGGTSTQVRSCVPDPCTPNPPPGTVCCLPGSAQGAFVRSEHDGDSDAECEEVASVEACMAQGGAVVSATSCDPNPCKSAPPTTVCCVPGSVDGAFVGDDGGGCDHRNETKCVIHESPDACTASGGAVVSASSCEPNPCVEPPPPPLGCCLPGSADGAFVADHDWHHAGGLRCEMLPPPACIGRGGKVSGPSCASDPCAPQGGGDGGDGNSQGDDDQGDNSQGDNGQGDQ